MADGATTKDIKPDSIGHKRRKEEPFSDLLSDGATAAETGRFIERSHFAVLMLLVLAEHPCEREHDTLLADGVFVP